MNGREDGDHELPLFLAWGGGIDSFIIGDLECLNGGFVLARGLWEGDRKDCLEHAEEHGRPANRDVHVEDCSGILLVRQEGGVC